MRPHVNFVVFLRGQEVAAGWGVMQKYETFRMFSGCFSYKFRACRWFFHVGLGAQLFWDILRPRVFELSTF